MSLWQTCSRKTTKAARNATKLCRIWWPSFSNRWTSYKKIWNWLLRGLKRGHRQRELQHTILRSHPWDILACHRVAHQRHRWRRRLVWVWALATSRRHRQCHLWYHRDLLCHRRRRCRWRSSRATARQRWGSYQWAIPWLSKWRILNPHLVKWSKRSRVALGVFHQLHVMTQWRGRRRSPL